MSQLFCPNCQEPYRFGVKFCSHCGYALQAGVASGTVSLQVGQVMNKRYTILRPLGKGGMGALYLAEETIANRPRQVVIKEMIDYFDPNNPGEAQKARERFEAEAGTLVSLNFANIPQIFEYFSEGGRNYIVMQYIEGSNFETGLTHEDDQGHLFSGKPYPAEQVRQWGIQISKILEYLASKNMVHMDIKPANLILDRAGNIWLVDFGTAKGPRTPQGGGQVGMKKTSIFGTEGYAPPEQYKGQYETRSDIHALAATLYHLATDDDPGTHPFKFPRLSQLPENLRDGLQGALVTDVNQRITATQFRQILESQTPLPSSNQSQNIIISPPPTPQPPNLFAKAVNFVKPYAPVFDWMSLGGAAMSSSFFALAYLLFWIAGAAIWKPVVVCAVIFGLILMGIGLKTRGEWQRWGLLGLFGGAVAGYLLYLLAGYLVAELNSPLNALWIGGLLGIGVGLVLAISQTDLPIPGFGEGRWTIGIAGVLLFVGIITGVSWLVNDFPQIYAYSKAERYFEDGNWEQAKRFYLSTYQKDSSYKDTRTKLLQSAYALGMDCLDQEVWACAEEQFAFILDIDPAYSDASVRLIEAKAEPHYRIGLEYLFDEAWVEAQTEFESVVAVDPNYKDTQTQLTFSRAEPHYLLGVSALENKNWAVAQAELEAALAVDADYRDAAEQLIPARAEPHYLQGQDELANERWTEAQAAFEAVIAIKSDYKDVQQLYLEAQVEGSYRAGLAFEEGGAWADAMRAYNAVLEIATTYKDTSVRWQDVVEQLKTELYQEGVAQSAQGDWAEAAQSFAKLRALDPLYEDLPARVLVPELQTALQAYYAQQWQKADVTLLYALEGHLDQITDLAFSPLDMTLVTASQDGTVKFWDATRGVPLRTLQAHENGVNALDFANFCHLQPDAQDANCTLVLASAGQDNTAIIWDANTGQALNTLTLHHDPVTDIAFNMDGSILATTSVLDDIRIWNTFGGVYRYRIDVHNGAVLTLVWNPLEKILATGGEEHLINLLNVRETWDSVATMDAHSEPVTSLAFTPDGKFLASGDMQGKTLVWNLPALSGVSGVSTNLVLDEEIGAVWGLDFSPSGLLLAIGKGPSAQIWLIPARTQANAQHTQTLELPVEPGTALAFSPDGWLLAIAGVDGKIYVWAPLVEP